MAMRRDIIRQYDLLSFTDPSKKPYKISECDDGHWECSCPDWINRRRALGTDCKHIRKIKETLATQPQRDFKPIAPNYTVKPYQAPSKAAQVDTSRDIVVGDYVIRPRQLDFIPDEEEVKLNVRRRSL